MSGRDVLERRLFFVVGSRRTGVVVVVVGTLLMGWQSPDGGQAGFIFFTVGLFATLIAANVVGRLTLCCPWCGGSLCGLLLWHNRLRVNGRVVCCPYCAHGLDEDLCTTSDPSSNELHRKPD